MVYVSSANGEQVRWRSQYTKDCTGFNDSVDLYRRVLHEDPFLNKSAAARALSRDVWLKADPYGIAEYVYQPTLPGSCKCLHWTVD